MGDYREILTDNEVVQSYAYPIEVKIYKDGVQVIPSSSTITVKDPDGTAQVEDAAMSVAVAGTMSYSLSSTYMATLWENAIIEIEYVISSVTHKMVRFFDVVLNKLRCGVIDVDLTKYYPQLGDERWSTQTTYDNQIEEAFRIVKQDIHNRGRRPHMLIDGEQVRELIILKALEIVFFAFFKDQSDEWFSRYEAIAERYKVESGKLIIKYDTDEDGLIDDDEKETMGQIRFVR